MKRFQTIPTLFLALLSAAALLLSGIAAQAAPDPLPSWNEGSSREAIVSFVASVTDESSKDYVPPTQRIATFDNDGTAALLKMVMATHAEMTTDEFEARVMDWLDSARHPRTGRPYTAMVYQPMLELLDYLRANGFTTYIVSGGGIEFMRPWTEGVYGIPPEQVMGSSIKTKYEVRDGTPVLARLPEMNFIDDKEGKPVGINQHIGRRPILAVGNSDGDFQMREWTTAGEGSRMGILIHHNDAEREWAYDRDSHIGRLVRGLDEGPDRGWTIVDMKDDWKTVFPPR